MAGDSAREFVDSIRSLAKFLRETERPAFAALDASPLTEIRNKYGPLSEQYTVTLLELRSLVNVAMTLSDNLNFAYLTYSNHVRGKRAAEPQQTQSPLPSDRPAPQQPIGSISTCFTTADACNNGTSSCSGRGQCVEAKKAGRSCFVCTCGVTKTGSGAKTKTDVWVGESCERKDISGYVSSIILRFAIAYHQQAIRSLDRHRRASNSPSSRFRGALVQRWRPGATECPHG